MRKRFPMIVLIVIGFLILISIVIFYVWLGANSAEWKIEVIDLSIIVRENPLTVQEGIQAARILREFEMRIAAFQIRDPKGGFIFDQVARKWQQKGLIKGYSTGFEQKDIYLLFNDKRVEFWTDADKFFTAEGEIILLLLNEDGEIIADARAEVNIDHQPPSVDDL